MTMLSVRLIPFVWLKMLVVITYCYDFMIYSVRFLLLLCVSSLITSYYYNFGIRSLASLLIKTSINKSWIPT